MNKDDKKAELRELDLEELLNVTGGTEEAGDPFKPLLDKRPPWQHQTLTEYEHA